MNEQYPNRDMAITRLLLVNPRSKSRHKMASSMVYLNISHLNFTHASTSEFRVVIRLEPNLATCQAKVP